MYTQAFLLVFFYEHMFTNKSHVKTEKLTERVTYIVFLKETLGGYKIHDSYDLNGKVVLLAKDHQRTLYMGGREVTMVNALAFPHVSMIDIIFSPS